MTTNDESKSTQIEKAISASTSGSISKIIPFLMTIAISATIAILYTNLYTTRQTEQLGVETQQLKQEQTQLNATNQAELVASEQRMGERITTLNKALESALQERWYQSSDWVMLKAHYYLELASVNQRWSPDLATTKALLTEADALLSTIQGERLTKVRQAIAQEQLELLQIKPIDTTGLLLQLDAIQRGINTLPPKKQLLAIGQEQTTSAHDNLSQSWREHLKHTFNKLSALVIIRHQDDTIAPILTPTYISMVCENVRLNLQEAQWAVLQQNQAVFQLTLGQALDNLNRVFDSNDANTAGIANQLKALKNQQVTYDKPSLEQSLQLLNELITAKTSQHAGEQPS